MNLKFMGIYCTSVLHHYQSLSNQYFDIKLDWCGNPTQEPTEAEKSVKRARQGSPPSTSVSSILSTTTNRVNTVSLFLIIGLLYLIIRQRVIS